MKNNKKGFAGIGIILAIIAVLAIGGGAYYIGKKSNTLPKVEENNLQQEEQNQNITTKNQVKNYDLSQHTDNGHYCLQFLTL